MTGPVKKTRVEYFIATYGALDEETESLIWERVHRGGYGPDDPVSMQIAHDTIFEARMKANLAAAARLPGQIKEAVDASLSAMQTAQAGEQTAYAKKMAHQIAQETRSSLAESMPRLEAQLAQGARSKRALARMLLVFSLLLIAALTGVSSVIIGRVTTADLDLQFAEQARRPDAGTWLNLQRMNGDLDVLIANHCSPEQAGYLNDSSGRAACKIPLWLEDEFEPTPIGYFAHAKGFIASAWARTSYEVLVILGLVLAVAVLAISAGIKAWMVSKDTEPS